MLTYQHKFTHNNGSFILHRRECLFGIIPLNKWKEKTTPFGDIKTLYNICQRREISKIVIESEEITENKSEKKYAVYPL